MKKILKLFLSVVLIFSAAIAIIISANSNVTYADKFNYSLGPTNEITSFSDIDYELLKNKLKKLEDETKKKAEERRTHIANEVMDITSDLLDFIVGVSKNGENPDWNAICYELYETAVKVLTLIALPVPGASQMAESVLGIVKKVLTLGEGGSQSELQQLESRLKEQFKEVKENINEVKKEISQLSKSLKESTDKIINSLKSGFEASTARTQLINFSSSKDGNFDYNLLGQYLYGSTDPRSENYSRYAYSAILDNKLIEEESEEAYKKAYDDLFIALDVQPSTNQKALFDIFYDDYLVVEKEYDKTIQCYFYDYLSYIGDEEAKESSLKFMDNLYSTAIDLNLTLNKCYEFQKSELLKTYGNDINDYSKYYYGEGNNDFIYYKDILARQEYIDVKFAKFEKQLFKDFVYISGIDDSYQVENVNFETYTVLNTKDKTYGNVPNGSTIYLNKYFEWSNGKHTIDSSSFKYQWYLNNELVAENDGLYKVTDYGKQELEAKVLYDDIDFYSIKFKVGNDDAFFGGSGTENDPYIISTPKQLLKAKEDLSNSYKLINDIDLNMAELSPFGDKEDKYNGVFYGQGYTISNFVIKAEEYGGLFGYIGLDGIIRDLTLANFESLVNSTDIVKIYNGAYAGISEGIIYKCKVVDDANISSKLESTESGETINKAIFSYTGGFVGEQKGDIYGCSFDAISESKIYSEISRHYGANSDKQNKEYAYVGGISGQLSGGKILSCYVNDLVDIDVFGESYCNKSLSTRYPYMTLLVGGITGKVNEGNIDNSFSGNKLKEKNNNKATKMKYENTHWLGGSLADNIKIDFGNYIPEISEDREKDIKAKSKEDIGVDYYQRAVITYEIKTDINENYNCHNDALYDVLDKNFKSSNLVIKVDNEEVDYSIEDIYNFNTKNSDKTNPLRTEVKILFSYIKDNKVIFNFLTLPIVVKENTPNLLKVLYLDNLEKTEINGEEFNIYHEDDELFSKGEKLALYYKDGSYEEVEAVASVNTLNLGLNEINFSYFDSNINTQFEATYTIFVKCNNKQSEYVFKEKIEPTCEHNGYSIYECPDCGDTYIKDIVGKFEHEYVLKGAFDSTCKEEGFTGDLVCSDCGYISVFGEVIPLKPHIFEEESNNDLHHFCHECNEPEEHIWVTTENEDGTIIFKCKVCKYQKISEPNLTDISRVIVSNASALKGKEVVVYVQLLNNSGICGVSCSIIYDERLEYISCGSGTLLKDTKIIDTKVRDGLVNVTLVQTDNDYGSGTILKLVFKTPDDAEVGTEYAISIGYTQSQDQFVNQNREKMDVITIGGTITVCDRLPGDINNDGKLDLLDSILAGLMCNDTNAVNKELLEQNNSDRRYADVNLDGNVSLLDELTILQHIVGGYDAQVYYNKFKLYLNYNDGYNEEEILDVLCKDEEGNKLNWNTIEELSRIMQRDGYHFEGWYRYNGTKLDLEANSEILYSEAEYNETKKQTLYAHWSLIKINFDGSGATKGSMESVTYSKLNGEAELELTNDFEKTCNIKFEDNKGNLLTELNTKITYTFLGWALNKDATAPDYVIGDKINLKDSNTINGEITLYAVWSKKVLILPDPNITGTIFNNWAVDGENIGGIGDEYYPTSSVIIVARYGATKYNIIFDANAEDATGAMSEIGPIAYDTEKNKDDVEKTQLPSCGYSRVGYNFVGWSTSKDANSIKYKDRDEVPNNLTDGDDITLYAIWELIPFTLNLMNQDPGTDYKDAEILKSYYGEYGCNELKDGENIIDKIIIPSLKGYTFSGYNVLDNDGNVVEQWIDKDGDINFDLFNKLAIGNVYLYPTWEAKSITIVYNFKGISQNIDGQDTYYIERSYTYKHIQGNEFKPSSQYYDFKGWASNEKAKTEDVIGDLNTIYEDTVLYSVWEPKVFKVKLILSLAVNHDETFKIRIDYSNGKKPDELTGSTSKSIELSVPYQEIKITFSNGCKQSWWYFTDSKDKTLSNISSGIAFTITKDIKAIYKCTDQHSCTAAGTLVTMADYSQKKIEDLTPEDVVLVFEHETGKFVGKQIAMFAHYEDEWRDMDVLELIFDNNEKLKVIRQHCLFSIEENRYVCITESNVNEYIGKHFVSIEFVDGNPVLRTTKLIGYDLYKEYTHAFSFTPCGEFNSITENILSSSMTIDLIQLLNLFDYNEDLSYDMSTLEEDIEMYGLVDYSEYEEVLSKEIFDMYNVKYYKIFAAKGRLDLTIFNYFALSYTDLINEIYN